MIYEIVGIGLLGVIIASLIKEVKPSFVVLIVLATSLIILAIIAKECKGLFDKVAGYIDAGNGGNNILKLALKIVGVGYVVELGCDVATDAGFQSIANKIAFSGKIIIATMCVPYLFDFFDKIMGLV